MENNEIRIGAWGTDWAHEGSCVLCDEPAVLEDDTAFILPVKDWETNQPVVDWTSKVFVPVCRNCYEAARNGR